MESNDRALRNARFRLILENDKNKVTEPLVNLNLAGLFRSDMKEMLCLQPEALICGLIAEILRGL